MTIEKIGTWDEYPLYSARYEGFEGRGVSFMQALNNLLGILSLNNLL